jgi:hypothetical protein
VMNSFAEFTNIDWIFLLLVLWKSCHSTTSGPTVSDKKSHVILIDYHLYMLSHLYMLRQDYLSFGNFIFMFISMHLGSSKLTFLSFWMCTFFFS